MLRVYCKVLLHTVGLLTHRTMNVKQVKWKKLRTKNQKARVFGLVWPLISCLTKGISVSLDLHFFICKMLISQALSRNKNLYTLHSLFEQHR